MLNSVIVGLVNIILGVVEVVVGLRILLKLFAANTSAPFVMWIYETSESLIYPFKGMFPSPAVEGGIVIEFSALFALVCYALIGFLIIEGIKFINLYVNRFSSRS